MTSWTESMTSCRGVGDFVRDVIDSVEAVTDSVEAFTDPAWDFGLTVMPVGDALSSEPHP